MSSLNTALMKIDSSMVKKPQSLKVTRENLEKIIIGHSIVVAAAGLGGGVVSFFLPGAGGVISTLTATGSIWLMYYNICKELGISIPKNILKALGSAMLANVVTQLGGLLLLDAALTLVPGLAIPVCGAMCYGVNYLAGYLFILLLVEVFGGGRDPQNMSEAELKNAATAVCSATSCGEIYTDAYKEAKDKIKKGEITKDSGR